VELGLLVTVMKLMSVTPNPKYHKSILCTNPAASIDLYPPSVSTVASLWETKYPVTSKPFHSSFAVALA